MFKRLFLAALSLATATPALASPLDVDGVWRAAGRDPRNHGHVRISDCGDGTPCGVLVRYDTGQPTQRSDVRNRDPNLRTRPLVGVIVLWGFVAIGERWRRGRLYNPEDGSTFATDLRLDTHGNLHVTGCLGPLCQTKVWTRVEEGHATHPAVSRVRLEDRLH